MEATCVWDVRAKLGEGPVWIAEEAALYFVDIKGQKVHRLHPESGEKKSWDAPEMVGFVLPVEGGGFIAGLQSGLFRFDPESGEFTLLREVEPELPDNRLNDGYVDHKGRLWFGSMNNPETAATGRLYCLADGKITAHDEGYIVTNGPAMSPDGKTLYHVNTLEREVYAYDLDEAGATSNKRLFTTVQRDVGFADGPAVDAEGCLWLSLYKGWSIERFAADGTLAQSIPMPVPNITKVAFGGPDLMTAYVTTAWMFMSDEERETTPQAGSLFAFPAGVAGQPQYKVRL
jgi:sugar lactone lactonase YvrE